VVKDMDTDTDTDTETDTDTDASPRYVLYFVGTGNIDIRALRVSAGVLFAGR
jgi:hypothetical protein